MDNLIEEIVREQYGDMPRGELETVKEFVFRDFMHFLAARAGIYTWKKFSESRARQRLCVYIEKNWGGFGTWRGSGLCGGDLSGTKE